MVECDSQFEGGVGAKELHANLGVFTPYKESCGLKWVDDQFRPELKRAGATFDPERDLPQTQRHEKVENTSAGLAGLLEALRAVGAEPRVGDSAEVVEQEDDADRRPFTASNKWNIKGSWAALSDSDDDDEPTTPKGKAPGPSGAPSTLATPKTRSSATSSASTPNPTPERVRSMRASPASTGKYSLRESPAPRENGKASLSHSRSSSSSGATGAHHNRLLREMLTPQKEPLNSPGGLATPDEMFFAGYPQQINAGPAGVPLPSGEGHTGAHFENMPTPVFDTRHWGAGPVGATLPSERAMDEMFEALLKQGFKVSSQGSDSGAAGSSGL